MGDLNELLIAAEIMTDGGGLKPTGHGSRVAFSGRQRGIQRSVRQCRGPCIRLLDLEGKDLDEAIDWVKRCPNPMPGPSTIEIRPLYEMEDFA